jgi:hypothetical protein
VTIGVTVQRVLRGEPLSEGPTPGGCHRGIGHSSRRATG